MKTFDQIKKTSESYAKMMRNNFPLSFENEKLNKLLCDIVFDDEKSVFIETLEKENKLSEFKNYIYYIFGEEKEEKEINKSVKELLDIVGYDFYVCKTEKDVKQFKKYYKEGEVICTFNNIEGRLSSYHIFWIVRKDIDTIKHQGNHRNRQDIYGTSCCSIQINKNNNSDISIKNRYNHNVNNCDATFSNNLDNIVEGLTQAINKEFNLKTSIKKGSFELNKFTLKDNKFMYYNHEINNIYYGINKIYKNGEITIYNPDEYILIDYYLINIKGKIIEKIDSTIDDDFFNFKFNKIIIKKEKIYNFKEDEDVDGVLVIYK